MENQTDTTPDRPSFLHRYPAIVHTAVVSAFILPITLLPYLVARRRISGLRQTVMQLERKTSVLQKALDLNGDSHNIMKGEVKRLQDLSRTAVEETAMLRKEVIKQTAERRLTDEALTSNLRRLLDDSRNARPPMHALGSSLADIAAFMQEVEIDFGMNPASGEDRRGINRLRVLARQLQSQPVDESEDEDFAPWR